MGEGVKISNPGNGGGFPCLSTHGSWRRQMSFSGFWEKSCSAEIVIAWPCVQFSSCTDPTACSRVIYAATPTMGASPSLVAFMFGLVRLRSLMRSGQLGSLALWSASQLTYQMGR